ncbi:MAG: DUF6754 domain-containing protein [bacterium]|nr:DUF6754 domain-containing protein [bacterium]
MGIEHASLGMIIIMIILALPLFYFINRAKAGHRLFVRKIAGIDAINQAIGRAAEMGRPVSFSTGLTSVSPTLYAVLGILFHVSRRCALYKNKLLLPQYSPEVMVIAETVMKDAYRVEGRSHEFDPSNIMFLSDEQFAFSSGYMGLIHREKVASAFLFGYFAAESLILAEAGQQVGAMQVAGSVSPEQVPFFITACDYTLIGEELFAAAAYLTNEPVQMGSLYAQDRAKIVIFGLMLLGVAIATAKVIWPEISLPDIDELIRTPWEKLF